MRKSISDELVKGQKLVVLFGARQTGKTSLLNSITDEGQKIPDLGIHLKILHDELPALRVVVTGSPSFDLATKIGKPRELP